MTLSRPRYERSATPPPMRFQERDGEILQAVYDYDGVLSRRHLKAMFWPNTTWRAMEMRLSLLYHQGYLDWPNADQWRTKPIPEAVCWLGWRGVLWIAGHAGLETLSIAKPSESKLRESARLLRKQNVHWLREPRWHQLEHDLAVVDFRLAVESSLRELPDLVLEKWLPEGAFLSNMDVVEYSIRSDNRATKTAKRGVRPDGYFVLVDKKRLSQGLPARARFLIEIDMSTHDVGSFVIEKAVVGSSYIQSPAYKARFGANTGSWLIVTISETRQKHLMRQIQQAIGAEANAFLFTTQDEIARGDVLRRAIWRQAEKEKPIALFDT